MTTTVKANGAEAGGRADEAHVCVEEANAESSPEPAADDYNSIPTFPVRPSFKDFQNALRPASQTVVFDGCPDDPHHPSSTPIYQTSTFVQPGSSSFGPYDYTRSGNPTRTALEKHVALLERGMAAFAFTSGMAALNTLTNTVLKAGDRVLLGDDIYGGMHRLVTKITKRMDVSVEFVDTTDMAAVRRALDTRTRLVHIESPSNPRMKITDIRELSKLIAQHNEITGAETLLSIDATMMSPCLMRPLELGVDIVVHSATKFFGGHADAMGGFIVVNREELAVKVAFVQNAEGTALAPFDCWLFLRGIKTMAIRIDAAQRSAVRVAAYLQKHPLVKRVYYAGLSSTPGYDVHKRQSSGPGTVMSFTTGSMRLSRRFCDACRIFKITVSFGSCNSLCEMPCAMSHASIDKNERTLPEDLVRLSIGIEDTQDIIDDIEQAFETARSNVKDIKAFYRGLVAPDGSPLTKVALSPPRSPAMQPLSLLGDAKSAQLHDSTQSLENLLFDSKFEDLPTVPPPVAGRGTRPRGPGPTSVLVEKERRRAPPKPRVSHFDELLGRTHVLSLSAGMALGAAIAFAAAAFARTAKASKQHH